MPLPVLSETNSLSPENTAGFDSNHGSIRFGQNPDGVYDTCRWQKGSKQIFEHCLRPSKMPMIHPIRSIRR